MLIKQASKCRNRKTLEQLRDAQKAKADVIAKSKKMHFRQSVHDSSVSARGVWKLAKYGREQSGKPRPVPKFPPLKRPDGTLADTFDGKIDALRGAFFPPPP